MNAAKHKSKRAETAITAAYFGSGPAWKRNADLSVLQRQRRFQIGREDQRSGPLARLTIRTFAADHIRSLNRIPNAVTIWRQIG
jgi:hypothetical protein